jgi:L-ascorbate metabolism protein UlaG (beta-lactamase superfamily)
LVLLALGLLGWAAGSAAASAKRGPAPLPRATIKARIHLLGAKNVNARTGAVRKDRVIFSWFTGANFVAAIKGHVVLLDAFARRAYDLGRLHTTVTELAALKPEYIFVGHAHTDVSRDVPEIAERSGTTVIGMPEHCDRLRGWAKSDGWDPDKLKCISPMTQGAALGTTVHKYYLKDVPLTIVRHVHVPYTVTQPTGLGDTALQDEGGADLPCPQEPRWKGFPRSPDTAEQRQASMRNFVGADEFVIPQIGGSLLYQFHVGKLNVTWADTDGPLDHYPEVVKALRALPPSDIEIGSLVSVNTYSDCLHDVRLYWEALRARVFVPMHHDLANPSEPDSGFYKPYLADEAARTPAPIRPCLHYIEDPQHYLNPDVLTWKTNAPAHCDPKLELPAQRLSAPPHPEFVRGLRTLFGMAGN